jgi:hypothetical protein
MPQHFPKTKAELNSYLQQLKAGAVRPLPVPETLNMKVRRGWTNYPTMFTRRVHWLAKATK